MNKRKWSFVFPAVPLVSVGKRHAAATCAAPLCGRVADRLVQYPVSRRVSHRLASCSAHGEALLRLAAMWEAR
jgi:hypothetical protein